MMPAAVNDVRAEALFVSSLQCSDQPSGEQVRATITATLSQIGETGCVERVAQEFGDHPDAAVERMQWCRTAVADAFFDALV